MHVPRNMINDELVQKAAMEEIARPQQEILQNPHEMEQLGEVLAKAYEGLTDEQKMALDSVRIPVSVVERGEASPLCVLVFKLVLSEPE